MIDLVLESIKLLPEQCDQVLEMVKNISIPSDYRNVNNLVFCGMGGSAYGGRIIKSLFQNKEIKIPIEIISDYNLPAYVGADSLVVLSSYSGGTEETVTCAHEAKKRKAKLLGITCGIKSRLSSFFASGDVPSLIINPQFNPSRQPRTAQGYMNMGQIALISKTKLLSIKEMELQEVIVLLKNRRELANTSGKKLARKIYNKIIVLVGGEFLEGPIHAIRNPIHETGKNFATYFILPELNHHLLESLSHPKKNREILLFMFIESDFYSDPIKKRLLLTMDVVKKNNLKVLSHKLKSKTKIRQAFELIQFGNFMSYYLALLNNVDPAEVPWVSYFQETFKRKH